MKELLEILETCCPDVDFEHETALIDDGILTSLDIVMIVGELNDAYDILHHGRRAGAGELQLRRGHFGAGRASALRLIWR